MRINFMEIRARTIKKSNRILAKVCLIALSVTIVAIAESLDKDAIWR